MPSTRRWASFAEHANEGVRANIQWATEKWAAAVFAAISAFCADSDCKEAMHEAVNRVSLVAAKSDDTPTRQRHTFALDKDQKVLQATASVWVDRRTTYCIICISVISRTSDCTVLPYCPQTCWLSSVVR